MLKKIMTGLAIVGLFNMPTYAHTMKDIAGVYDESGVDSVSRHYLLPTGEYCYILMAGMLDLHLAGHWQIDKTENGKTLIKVSPQALVKTPFPVWINHKQSRDERTLKFITSRMQMAGETFIGFGEQADKPSVIAPIFDFNHELKGQYELAVPKSANYLFVGQNIGDNHFELTRYTLSKDIKHTIQLGYDINADYAKQFEKLVGQFHQNKMAFGLVNDPSGQLHGTTPRYAFKTDRDIQEAKQCANAVLKGDPLVLFPEKSELLTPTTIIWQGKPTEQAWF